MEEEWDVQHAQAWTFEGMCVCSGVLTYCQKLLPFSFVVIRRVLLLHPPCNVCYPSGFKCRGFSYLSAGTSWCINSWGENCFTFHWIADCPSFGEGVLDSQWGLAVPGQWDIAGQRLKPSVFSCCCVQSRGGCLGKLWHFTSTETIWA